MKLALTFLYILVLLLPLQAQDVSLLVKEADKLELLLKEKSAYDKFREVLRMQPNHLYALIKCSELCCRIGFRETTSKARNDYYDAAKKYATTALQVNAGSSDANTVMAMALGRVSMEKSGKEKVAAAKEIKKYVDEALRLDRNNHKAWHVLGRWNFEICSLNFIERAAVKVFFGGMPRASLKDAIAAYEKAAALSPGFILNYYELARAYKKNDQSQKAIATLKNLLQLPDKTEDDAQTKVQARKLLKELE